MGNMQEIKDRLTALEDIVFDVLSEPEVVEENEPKPKSKKKTKKKEGK